MTEGTSFIRGALPTDLNRSTPVSGTHRQLPIPQRESLIPNRRLSAEQQTLTASGLTVPKSKYHDSPPTADLQEGEYHLCREGFTDKLYLKKEGQLHEVKLLRSNGKIIANIGDKSLEIEKTNFATLLGKVHTLIESTTINGVMYPKNSVTTGTNKQTPSEWLKESKEGDYYLRQPDPNRMILFVNNNGLKQIYITHVNGNIHFQNGREVETCATTDFQKAASEILPKWGLSLGELKPPTERVATEPAPKVKTSPTATLPSSNAYIDLKQKALRNLSTTDIHQRWAQDPNRKNGDYYCQKLRTSDKEEDIFVYSQGNVYTFTLLKEGDNHFILNGNKKVLVEDSFSATIQKHFGGKLGAATPPDLNALFSDRPLRIVDPRVRLFVEQNQVGLLSATFVDHWSTFPGMNFPNLTIHGNTYKIHLSNDTSLTAEPTIFVGNDSGQELLTLNPNSPVMNAFAAEFHEEATMESTLKSSLKKMTSHYSSALTAQAEVDAFIEEKKRDSPEECVTVDGERFLSASLDEFHSRKLGACRHRAMAAAFVFEKMSQKPDSKIASVKMFSDYVENGAHAWVGIKDKAGQSYLFDAFWNITYPLNKKTIPFLEKQGYFKSSLERLITNL